MTRHEPNPGDRDMDAEHGGHGVPEVVERPEARIVKSERRDLHEPSSVRRFASGRGTKVTIPAPTWSVSPRRSPALRSCKP